MLKLFKSRYTPDFKHNVPTNSDVQLKTESFGHKLTENWRLLRRQLSLSLNHQLALEVKTIPQQVQNILWVSSSVNNIGDAIMALSGRALLGEKYHLDVLLNPKYAELFKNDKFFRNVYIDVAAIHNNYDFIILDSVKSRSLRIKYKYFKNLPFAHFRGHFDGIEFNWVLFSFHRINAMLNYPYTLAAVDEMAKPSLFLADGSEVSPHGLVIAIGGEDVSRRVYHNWYQVIYKVCAEHPDLQIYLVGNENAKAEAQAIMRKVDSSRVINHVAALRLWDTALLIQRAKYFIGCDGGLMHIAAALGKSGVALFGHFAPQFRLALKSKLYALYDAEAVNNLHPETIYAKFHALTVDEEGKQNG